jgi:hypothetical protein
MAAKIARRGPGKRRSNAFGSLKHALLDPNGASERKWFP